MKPREFVARHRVAGVVATLWSRARAFGYTPNMPAESTRFTKPAHEPPATAPMAAAGAVGQGETLRADASPTAPIQNMKLPDFPGYETLRLLGRGGMGQVFLVRDRKLERLVALKMLGGWAASDPRLFERFQTEIKAVARLAHPNIAQVFEAGEGVDQPWFTMEYVAGGSLAELLSGKPLPPRFAAELVETLARAMQHAHDQGVLHRDLKPANVLLSGGSEPEQAANAEGLRSPLGPLSPKITDFGLAKRMDSASNQTKSGEVMGTPSYMAPEQASGVTLDVGPACDVYQLGAILYECLTGRPPFLAPDPFATVVQVMTEEPATPRSIQPGVPRDLETICLKCLAKAPLKRYRTAKALADDLRRFLDEKPIVARPTPWWERLRKWRRRHPSIAALVAVGLLAAAALVAGALYWRHDAAVRQQQAETMLDLALAARSSVERGAYLKSSGRAAEARVAFSQAIDALSQVRTVYATEAVLTQLARTYHLLGRARHDDEDEKRQTGRPFDYTLAIADYERAVELWRDLLASSSAPPDARRELGRSLNNLGNCRRDTQRFDLAADLYRQSREILEWQVHLDPRDAETRSILGLVIRNGIKARLDRGEPIADGEDAMREAVRQQQEALQIDPGGNGYADRLAWSQHVFCQLLMRNRDTAKAARELAILREQLGQLSTAARVAELRNAIWLCAEFIGEVQQDARMSAAARATAVSAYANAALGFLRDRQTLKPVTAAELRSDPRLKRLLDQPELQSFLGELNSKAAP